jgi:hypothetical protein
MILGKQNAVIFNIASIHLPDKEIRIRTNLRLADTTKK